MTTNTLDQPAVRAALEAACRRPHMDGPKVREGLTRLASDATDPAEAIALLDRATRLDAMQALMFL